MITVSVGPVPVKSNWFKRKSVVGVQKEKLGISTIFHWHCQIPMKRVILYQKTDKGIRRVGCTGWICQKCETRKYKVFW